MYLDHRVTIKIARILNMIDMSALLLDNSGNVILPEGDQRVFNLPDAIRQNPTEPLVYGGITLIGTADDQPVFVCLQGNSEEVKKCALLCAELINMLLREDMSQTNREQSLRLILRGEVETSEFESLAAEHDIPMHGNRCVLYFYFQDLDAEAALQMMSDGLDSEDDLMTEVGRHSVAMLKKLSDEEPFEEMEEYARAIENSFLTETGKDVFVGVSETARKLYIHRNTLVYRLEKVQRAIGLDLRNFDDAVTFKMMMLLGKNTGNRKFRL